MGKRSEDWMSEFGHMVEEQTDPEVKALILDGSVEICPVCLELSAYAYQDTTDDDDDDKPAKGTIALISTAGMDEWECGHCRRHIMDSSSPLNHPCFTHEDD